MLEDKSAKKGKNNSVTQNDQVKLPDENVSENLESQSLAKSEEANDNINISEDKTPEVQAKTNEPTNPEEQLSAMEDNEKEAVKSTKSAAKTKSEKPKSTAKTAVTEKKASTKSDTKSAKSEEKPTQEEESKTEEKTPEPPVATETPEETKTVEEPQPPAAKKPAKKVKLIPIQDQKAAKTVEEKSIPVEPPAEKPEAKPKVSRQLKGIGTEEYRVYNPSASRDYYKKGEIILFERVHNWLKNGEEVSAYGKIIDIVVLDEEIPYIEVNFNDSEAKKLNKLHEGKSADLGSELRKFLLEHQS